jgi:hypothetical protein
MSWGRVEELLESRLDADELNQLGEDIEAARPPR